MGKSDVLTTDITSNKLKNCLFFFFSMESDFSLICIKASYPKESDNHHTMTNKE